MLVSILLMSYNNLDGLYPTLDSVFSQDYPEIEIIFSDDCSRDYAEKQPALARYAESHRGANIRSVLWNPHEVNVGTVRNTNSAVRQAHGEWILSMSSEDFFAHDHALSDLVNCLQETGREIVFGKVRGLTEDGRSVDYLLSCESDYDLLKSYTVEQTRNRLFSRNFLPAPAAMMSRALLERYRLYPEDTRLIEDYPCWLELTRHGVPFAYLDEVVVIYRLSGVSSTGSYGPAFMQDMYVIYDRFIFPYDHRFGILQGVYNLLKRNGLDFYMAKAHWSSFPVWKRALKYLRYLPFFVYTGMLDRKTAKKNQRSGAKA